MMIKFHIKINWNQILRNEIETKIQLRKEKKQQSKEWGPNLI
jgi:hypothetical protein